MALDWFATSEIVAGMILTKGLAPNAVDPNKLAEPYPTLVKLYQKKKTAPALEVVIDAVGLRAYNACIAAAEAVKGTPANWITQLDKVYAMYDGALRLEKVQARLKKGEAVDLAAAYAALEAIDNNETAWVKMSDVQPEGHQFIETGYEPIDAYIGNKKSRGIPKVGITVIAGPPGTGKTSLMLKTVINFVKKYECKAGIFSLEMTNEQLVERALEMMKVPKKIMDLIYLCEFVEDPDDMCAQMARLDGMGISAVDFSDLAINAEVNESSVSRFWFKGARTVKQLGIPSLFLSQLNRQYDGNLPSMTMLRNSDVISQVTPLGLLVYNPNGLLVKQDVNAFLPPYEDSAYLMIGKSRFGFPPHAPGLGAVRIPFKEEFGWGDKAIEWISLRGR